VLADDRIGPHIDPARIGVTGFSMGGFTAALMVGARADLARFNAFCAGPHRDAICNRQKEFPLDYREAPRVLARPAMAQVASREKTDLRDSRVRAAYLIDPALGEMIDEASLADVHVPVRVLFGIEDAIAPPATNAQRFARGISGASTRPLERVGHYDFLAECGDAGRKVAADYCAEPADAPRARTHQTTVDDALEFFRATLAPATQGSH
jgi:predicted dienelactone hydrolase